MRRAKLEGRHIGRHIGRHALELDEIAIQNQRAEGRSLRDITLDYHTSTATIRKILGRPDAACVKRVENGAAETRMNTGPETAA